MRNIDTQRLLEALQPILDQHAERTIHAIERATRHKLTPSEREAVLFQLGRTERENDEVPTWPGSASGAER